MDRLGLRNTSVWRRREASRRLGILGKCTDSSSPVARVSRLERFARSVGVVLCFTNWRRELVDWSVASVGLWWLLGSQPDLDRG